MKEAGPIRRRALAKAAAGAALLLLLLAPCPAGASGPAGTVPGREVETNQTPLGVGYYHRTIRMEPRESNFRATVFSQDQLFVEASAEKYGWGAFARAGAASLADEDGGGGNRFDESYRPFVGTGIRYHVPVSDDGATVVVGTARFSWTFPYKGTDRLVPSAPVPDRAKVQDFWSSDLTLALQQRIGPFVLFAGPAFQYSRLKVVRDEAGTVRQESAYDTASNLLGGIGGFRADFGKLSLQAEAQRFETTSFGGTLSYGF